MCLAAIYWARLRRVYFGGTRHDAARAGFDDAFLYRELARPLPRRTLPMKSVLRTEAIAAFSEWAAKTDKVTY